MPTSPARRGHVALLLAALLGLVHAGFSLSWALGGTWLLSTLGSSLVAMFAGMRWVLIPVALVKAGFALFPLLLLYSGWRGRPATRLLCWLGAAILVLWGGANTLIGNLVLAGVIHPDGGDDRAGMIGHAWLWDPLFLAWGLCVVVGLLASRRVRSGDVSTPRLRRSAQRA